VIAASGTLAQIIPPSLVLIIMADQLGRSVGDMYKGAFLPGFMLMGLYVLYVVAWPSSSPAPCRRCPPRRAPYREPNGSGGYTSLVVLMAHLVCGCRSSWHATWPTCTPGGRARVDRRGHRREGRGRHVRRRVRRLVIALINRVAKLGLLSRLAERVTFVLIPPLLLIFLVLGTIFLGVATPTEGGAMGAMGALIMAWMRRRLSLKPAQAGAGLHHQAGRAL
jgi:TRAP-type mannitol/chloroaromatic compound transport system permease large subunit